MESKKAEFIGFLKAQASDKHPLQTDLIFTFTDFQPNGNGQGISKSEADNIINTGIFMPIKVDFQGNRVGNHSNAIPVGPITALEVVNDAIIGKGIIWQNEFPELIKYLKTASTEEKGVQFSWELYYDHSELDKSNTEWLFGCIVAAITIVNTPAYKGRTALLAIAEEKQMEELQAQIESLQEKLYSMLDVLYQFTGEIAADVNIDRALNIDEAFQSIVEKMKRREESVSMTENELVRLNNELAELRSFKAQVENEKAKSELLTARFNALSGLMSDQDLTAKSEFLLTLSDAQFLDFVSSLQTIKKNTSMSSIKQTTLPDPLSIMDTARTTVTVSDLAHEILKNQLR